MTITSKFRSALGVAFASMFTLHRLPFRALGRYFGAGFGAGQGQTLQMILLAPSFEDLEIFNTAAAIRTIAYDIDRVRSTLVVVVTGRTFGKKHEQCERRTSHLVEPVFFRSFGGFDDVGPCSVCTLDDVGDMLGLLVQHVCKVEGEARLGYLNHKIVRKAVAVDAV